eukprot:2950190-Rhodomonas_salina.1
MGPKGETGDRGPAGTPGPPGPVGTHGADGAQVWLPFMAARLRSWQQQAVLLFMAARRTFEGVSLCGGDLGGAIMMNAALALCCEFVAAG